MEIKVLEIYEKFKNNQNEILKELNDLILGKNIELFEYNQDSKEYDLVDDYKVESTFMWEDDQIVFSFGPDEWDIVSINKTDLIKIKDENENSL